MSSLDAITFEVIWSAMDSIADQMAIALTRSAYSGIVRDTLDYSTAFCDSQGRMVAQGLTTPLHLGSFPDAMRHLVAKYGSRMRPGDIYIMNDPYGSGGMHLPDIYVIKPVFVEGVVEGYATSLAHQADIGGLVPGSNSIHSTEIYQEGLRIPFLKLYDAGEPNETMFSIIEHNVRVPVKVLGDIRAQVAACHTAEQAFLQLVERYGAPTLRRYLEEMLEYAERVAREEIAALPDGVYKFTDYIDGLGENPQPIVFHATVTIAGDGLTIDWAGTSPQVKGGINAPMPFAKSAAYVAVRSLMRQRVPNSEGYMRPISTIAEQGTVVNPVLPAACATRGITGFRMVDTIFGALAQAVPDRIPAACEGGATLPSIGGYQDGKPFVNAETLLGTWGARPNGDGAEGISNLVANQSNQPIELTEAEAPLEVTRYGFVPDSGGPGKFRGGLGIIREYRLLADEAVLAVRSDRRAHPPWGLSGGRPGAPSLNVLNPGPGERILPTLPMEAVSIRRGDVYRHVMAGGGGYGNPLERDPRLVLDDVLDEKVTIEHAREAYAVVIDPEALTVDLPATQRLRRQLRPGTRDQQPGTSNQGPGTNDQRSTIPGMRWTSRTGPMPAELRVAVSSFLERPLLAHLATLRADGSPHVTPLLVGFDGECFIMVITGTQKLRNLERDPRVGFSVTHEEDTGRHLAVEGNAELIYEGDDLVERRERLLAHYYGPEKARARRDVAFGPGVRAFVHIAPTRVVLNA